MASAAIRIGVIGANIHRGWAPQSHLPALAASPDFELVAVCTTRRETAEESARAFGADLAFGAAGAVALPANARCDRCW
jgi:predicted dehydrogenase